MDKRLSLYIEAFSGMSGDMFLSALAALADAYDELESLPEQLHLTDAKVEIRPVIKNGIACKHVRVIDLHDEHKHPHRHLSHIYKIIENASINKNAKEIAKSIFQIIGEAESRIHNIGIDKIHFHEISAIDSLIDIIGSAVLIDRLGITQSYATPVCLGFGMVQTQHGLLPVPAPATADILEGVPVYPGDEKGERTTPTGAAILKYLDPEFDLPVLKFRKTAYGPGQKDFKAANVLRLSLCEKNEHAEELYILETNIDDLPGEFLGNDFQDNLLSMGAVDFYMSHIQMKKGRPAIKLSCFVQEPHIQAVSEFIMENTSSIGVRYYPVKRNILQREIREYETPYGKIKAKVVTTPAGMKRFSVEYDDLKRINAGTNVPLQQLHQEIISHLNKDS